MFSLLFLASFQVSLVKGLPSSAYFHYHAENAISSGQWTDISGNGRHATVTSGTIAQALDENSRPYVYGSTSAVMVFPVPPGSYTFFHRARYNGGAEGRIFASDGHDPCNWLSGFHGGSAGIAYHGSWITSRVDLHSTDWVISTDQYDLYRSNGVQRSVNDGVYGSMCSLGVNVYNSEESDWAISEVIMYDRELSLAEIQEVEGYLESAPTGIPTSMPTSSVPTFNPTPTPTDLPTTLPTVTPCSGYHVSSPALWDSVTITSSSLSLVVEWDAATCTSHFVHFEFCFRIPGGQLRCWNTLNDSDVFATTGPVPNIGTGSLTFAAAPDTGSGYYLVRVVDDVTPAVYGSSGFFYVDFSALTAVPSGAPSVGPTSTPTSSTPTSSPTATPTRLPTALPTMMPTEIPSSTPTSSPTASPTVVPTASPTDMPTEIPTSTPTPSPTASPTVVPTASPTDIPTASPTVTPTAIPSSTPTFSPTATPTTLPTASPTVIPTAIPTAIPTSIPTGMPSPIATESPSMAPTTEDLTNGQDDDDDDADDIVFVIIISVLGVLCMLLLIACLYLLFCHNMRREGDVQAVANNEFAAAQGEDNKL